LRIHTTAKVYQTAAATDYLICVHESMTQHMPDTPVNPCGDVTQLHASMEGGYHTQHCRLPSEYVHCHAILLLQLTR